MLHQLCMEGRDLLCPERQDEGIRKLSQRGKFLRVRPVITDLDKIRPEKEEPVRSQFKRQFPVPFHSREPFLQRSAPARP